MSPQIKKETDLIWQEFHEKLYNFIKFRVSDSFVAEDILQDVFIKIYKNLNKINDRSKIKSWIYKITRNTIYDYYKSKMILEKLPEEILSPDKTINKEVENSLNSCLLTLINNLPDLYKEALIHSEINGETQKKLATLKNISLSAVKSRVQRGKKILKMELEKCCSFEFDHNGKIMECNLEKQNCIKC